MHTQEVMTKESEAARGQSLLKLCAVSCLMSLLPVSAIDKVNVVDFCGQMVHKDGLIVNSHQDSKKYYFVTTGTDCHFTMRANMLQDRVLFNFRFFLVYSLLRVTPLSPPPLFHQQAAAASDPSLSRPAWPDQRLLQSPPVKENSEDPCHTGSYIQFYDGPSKSSPLLGHALCGKSPPQPVISTGNYLTLRLVTRGTQPRVDFVGDFTSFRLGSNQSGCGNDLYFSCWNGKCIPISLICDDDQDIDNCGDGSDLRSQHDVLCTSHQAVKLSPQFLPPTSTIHLQNCGNNPEIATNTDTVADPASWSPVAVYVVLGLLGGSLLLCWCCWSPGWFLWRVSVCRFLPCCNSFCASCQLCVCSCSQKNKDLAAVSPQNNNANANGNAGANNSVVLNTTTVTL
ncbi:uncharacterized protein ldlrad2 [Engraulis encrasicolus]|uniref:uncharacterized protein ldlrad2 n=1 Tax=Engraulis encrasicolus TaxID=184585 RepID=UPI002FD36849